MRLGAAAGSLFTGPSADTLAKLAAQSTRLLAKASSAVEALANKEGPAVEARTH